MEMERLTRKKEKNAVKELGWELPDDDLNSSDSDDDQK